MSRCLERLLLMLLVMASLAGVLLADGVWSLGRSTNDRDVDLVDALIELERFEDALSLCRMLGRGADPQGDVAAKWAIHRSRVLVAQQMDQDQFDQADISDASKPITDLLTSYPEHRRKFFLLAQATMVQRNAALHHVLRAAVSPANDRARDEATMSLLSATEALESLLLNIADYRVSLDQQKQDRPFAMIDDLARLLQELQVETVSLALMQTELFAAASNDAIAAATRAEQIADLAIAKLPSDTKARSEVERLRIEAILRARQYDRADQELKVIMDADDPPSSMRWMALQTRLDMAQQRMGQAAARLDAYYGDQPTSAPRSIDMDLAKLEFMLRNDSRDGSGDWLDAIQARGGAYARRRAEAMALSLLGRSNATTMPAIDPAIVAAQGQDYLRRGEPGRAAELLAASARAESNADRAVQRAAEAAAAFVSVQRYREAASVLAEIAIANPMAGNAAAAHLQAAILVATHDTQAAERLEPMLRLNLEKWPTAETSPSTRDWLQRSLTSQQRYIEAAEVATAVPNTQLSPSVIDTIAARWQAALDNGTESSSNLSQRFLDAYQPLLSNEIAAERFPLLVALLVDRSFIQQANVSKVAAASDPFASALLAYRQHGTESEVLNSPPQDLVVEATQRLMRDGRENPLLRQSIARLISRWDGSNDRSLEHAERLLWAGQIDDCVKVVNDLIRAEPAAVDVTRGAARLLETSSDAKALKEAIRLWDQLASGAAQGTPLWHEAKLAGIAALQRSGNTVEAQRRAQYVLLTSGALDDSLRRQYETFAK